MADSNSDSVLLVRAGPHVCGLPLRHVAETMRPLPVTPLSGVPAHVEGAAIVRGLPMPVVLLARMLGDAAPSTTRFVRVRAGERQAIVAVDEVIGVAAVPPSQTVPLLTRAAEGVIDSMAALDRELLAVLDTARLVPAETWRVLASEDRE